ncbi:MAG: hypothetical protein QM645_13565 [Asticcacaulis sp.]
MFSRIFGALRPAYLIRAWLIGAAFLALIIWLSLRASAGTQSPTIPLIYFSVCTLLFPFAKLCWDELRNLLMGDNIVFLPAVLVWPLKLIINIMLWGFAVFIAPFGLLYLWFRTRP